jgi:hypothetical protein
MKFNGRWVPMEVMETIFGLWVVVALLVCGATYWMYRTRPSRMIKRGQDKPVKRGRKKRNRRKLEKP